MWVGILPRNLEIRPVSDETFQNNQFSDKFAWLLSKSGLTAYLFSPQQENPANHEQVWGASHGPRRGRQGSRSFRKRMIGTEGISDALVLFPPILTDNLLHRSDPASTPE
jgi:hypothetical protein